MSVDLLKRGQTVDLTKGRQGLTKITIGLSWGANAEEVPVQKKGLLARAFDALVGKVEEAIPSSSPNDMDIDSSVVMITRAGYVEETIYYGNLTSRCKSIRHAGDDLTGSQQKGQYDNEEIEIDLSRIPSNVEKLVFIANVYQGLSRGQHFGQVKGSYIRVLQTSNREEMIRYNLADDYNGKRGLIVGELYRYDGDWKFRAIGESTPNDKLQDLVNSVIRGGR